MTFLFTDVEGSTRLWAEDRDAMSASLQVHDRILRDAVVSRGGYVFATAGDSFAVAFARASEAVAAAEAGQSGLEAVAWPGPALRVRMGLHLGEAEERGGDYFGPTVNTAARVEAAAHGGQVLLTDPVRQAAGVGARDLGVHVLRDVPDPLQVWQLGDGDFPALRVVDPGLTNLPAAVTGLVGRTEDLHQVREALGLSRLVTLTAAGGTGKTRMALAVGEEELPHRNDGVWFVDLTPVPDGALVPATVAAGLGLSLVTGDPTEQILQYVVGKDLLLIVDNCEHLIDECAELAERFLTRPGDARLLATSRERLDVDGEQVLQIPPLSTDGAGTSTAVELFEQRARAVNASFLITEDNRGTIAQLCRRLDGMPLAIELAAARVTVMTPGELLAGIEDRFRLLGGRRRQRQRTLEATLDWSYRLLDEDEQAMLRSLGVFVGTFDLDAVAAVTDLSRPAAIDLIDSLVAKSLVVHEDTDGRSRFRLFETTNAYAQQRLADIGEGASIRDRHFEHYLELSRRHPTAMLADIAARKMLGPDKANIVSAIDWAGSRGRWAAAAELLLGALAVFYDHPIEGARLVEHCADNLGAEEGDLAMRLECNRWFLEVMVYNLGESSAIARRLKDSPTPLHQVYGYCLFAGMSAIIGGANAEQLSRKASEILRTLPPGVDCTQATATWHLWAGVIAMSRGQHRNALDHADIVVRLHNELGFESEMSAQALTMSAVGSLFLGDPSAALDAAERYQQLAHVIGTGDEIRVLAYVALDDLDKARAAARSHAIDAATGRVMHRAGESLVLLAVLADAEGDVATARDLMMNKGAGGQAGLTFFARRFAEQLGISAEYEAVNTLLYTDPEGDSVRRKATDDIETVRQEIVRRHWR